MIRQINKILITLVLIVGIIILYLSYFGIKTDKFNDIIKKEAINLNSRINLDLKNINILLNPFNFTLNFSTENPKILLDSNQIKLEYVNTNISIKSLINKEFSIDDLKISFKKAKLKNIILLARSFKDSTEFFLLDKIIKKGFLTGEIQFNFDNNGKIIDDYLLEGAVEKVRLSLLNDNNLENLEFLFKIQKKNYQLTKVKTNFNKIKLSSPKIKIKDKKDFFYIEGKILTKENDINLEKLKRLFQNDIGDLNLEKINFSSNSNFSFNISKHLKIKDLKIESQVDLKKLYLKNNQINLKSYFPNFEEELEFKNHKIEIIYKKNKLSLIGEGKILINQKVDAVSYIIKRNNKDYTFNINLNINQNPLNINFLDYSKNEKIKSSLVINCTYNKIKKTKCNNILFEENKNNISIKDLILNDKYKVLDIKQIRLNYVNNAKVKNEIIFKKRKKKYFITGKSFDATKIINELMGKQNEDSSIFNNLNSKFDIKIDKVYLDHISFVNNLFGTINLKQNKIQDLNLDSSFFNGKKITLTVKLNEKNEKITTLFSGYPKPLIKRFKFIKGFEEGILDFYSIKKDGVSNSLLTIDDFKIQEVPILAKLLSLASLQGIADLLTGDGIRFNNFEMKFSNKKDLMTIDELYAIGPAISILMDGYLEADNLVSLRGTLVPATTINKSIASIPLLGGILVGKKTGEGVFGVSFKIKGSPKDLKTTVNPIKTLTPRFITRTLEKIKKN